MTKLKPQIAEVNTAAPIAEAGILPALSVPLMAGIVDEPATPGK
jgi:hypothetical protein